MQAMEVFDSMLIPFKQFVHLFEKQIYQWAQNLWELVTNLFC